MKNFSKCDLEVLVVAEPDFSPYKCGAKPLTSHSHMHDPMPANLSSQQSFTVPTDCVCVCVHTGMNCAEAVNFGPPDWLPWGHYVNHKYRKDAKAATLSNDALLIALAKAAPSVQQRLAEVSLH